MSRLPKSLRWLFMACAGIGAFYASAQFSRAQRVAQAEIVQAVVPTIAAARSAAALPRTAAIALGAAAASAAAPAAASASAPAAGGASAPAATGDESLSLADRARSIPKATGDLFNRLSWLPPPPPPPPPAPPPPPPKPVAPTAPPLPFTFVGMVERGTAKPAAFLAKGDALLVVSAGDMLDNSTYRIDSLSPNGIVMTHLPTNIQQTLSVSGSTK